MSKKLKGISFDDLAEALNEDADFRAALIKHLAAKHSDDYLGEVNINARALNRLSARAISSNKEWQE